MNSTTSTTWIRVNKRLERVQSVFTPQPIESVDFEEFTLSELSWEYELFVPKIITEVEIGGFTPPPRYLPTNDWRQPGAGERIMMDKYNKWLKVTTSVEVGGFTPSRHLPTDDWRQPGAGERITMAMYNKWLNTDPK